MLDAACVIFYGTCHAPPSMLRAAAAPLARLYLRLSHGCHIHAQLYTEGARLNGNDGLSAHWDYNNYHRDKFTYRPGLADYLLWFTQCSHDSRLLSRRTMHTRCGYATPEPAYIAFDFRVIEDMADGFLIYYFRRAAHVEICTG